MNSPINSFCSLDTDLALISDNFLSIFPPTPPLFPSSCSFPGDSYLKMSCGTIFTVCSHTFILFWVTKTSVRVKLYHLSFNVLFQIICAIHPETSSFFKKVFTFYSYISVYFLYILYIRVLPIQTIGNGNTCNFWKAV